MSENDSTPNEPKVRHVLHAFTPKSHTPFTPDPTTTGSLPINHLSSISNQPSYASEGSN
jgi:hypothetical protein